MTGVTYVLLSLALSFSMIESATDSITALDWLANAGDLNGIFEAIDADPEMKNHTSRSFISNGGSSTFENFASDYRKHCGAPMETYARENNVTSEDACLWDFLREASQDSAFAFGIPFDRDIFTDCGDWLTKDDNADRFIIGMWAIYENKGEIVRKTGSANCENLQP